MRNNSSYPFPVLENGRFDYLDENSYVLERIQNEIYGDKMAFRHILKGKNLIAELIKNKEAKFFVTTVLKSAIHRETYQATQEIEILDDDYVEIKQFVPFLKSNKEQSFCGFIAYTGENKSINLNENHGINKFWNGSEIPFLKGMILAKSDWFKIEKNIGEMIIVRAEPNIKFGFKVEVSSEDGGRFNISMEEKLHKQLCALPPNNQIRNNFVNHILSACFYELKHEFDRVKEYENFEQLVEKIKEKGLPKIDDENFSPSIAASAFIEINLVLGEYDED